MKFLATLLLSTLCLSAAAQHTAPKDGARLPDGWMIHYADNRALVMRDSLYGYIDRSGREVIPCSYKKAYPFNDGIAVIRHGHEIFAIDTLGHRVDRQVQVPKFRDGDIESFATWIRRRIPFASSDEYRRLRTQLVGAVITVGEDGRIAECRKTGICTEEAFRKVYDEVMAAPAWTPGQVDGRPCRTTYLLSVDFRSTYPPKCRPVDASGEPIGRDLTYPLFQGRYASGFYDWFFRHARFKSSAEYYRAQSGPVRAAFTVDTKGRVRDIEILSFHNAPCRDKTVELLKKSPRWTPGTIDSKPVDVRYEMTFYFRYR